MLNKLICVCCKKDLPTFEIAARYIIKFIKAKSYVVVVPEDELQLFKKIAPHKFMIVSEAKYEAIRQELQKRLGKEHKRLGWYFQQFIKISELNCGDEESLNLIWDADTIPIKKIEFDTDGIIQFYRGDEFHKPYFILIEKILGMKKKLKGSFVAQCLPCKRAWVEAFQKTIEDKFNKTWYQAIIQNISIKELSGFSEYETLGTFILNKFPNQIYICNNKWHRHGCSLINNAKNIDQHASILATNYDFISFETWDNAPKSNNSLASQLKNFLVKCYLLKG